MGDGDGRPPVTAAWAKAGKGKEVVPHPVACHLIDTAAVALRLFEVLLGPGVRERLRRGFAPLGAAVKWIAFLCGLHDIGKYSPAFQQLRRDLIEALGQVALEDVLRVADPKGIHTDTKHGLITAVHMAAMLQSWGARGDLAEALARALGGHHGFLPAGAALTQAEGRPNDLGRARWARWRNDMIEELARACGLPAPTSLPWHKVQIDMSAAVALAGVTTVSDWIASDAANFPYAGSVTDLSAYATKAQERAKRALERLDWSRWQPPDDTSYARLFPGDKEIRPVQAVAERLVAGRREPFLLVVEAPTAEGKTKLAFQAVATLGRELRLAGTYYAMPTKATSDQVYRGLRQLLRSLGDATSVRLIYAMTEESPARSAARKRRSGGATRPRNVESDSGEGSDQDAWEWFDQHGWTLLASLGVGTIDQALKAAIRSRHVFVRLAALSNKVVVVDEVHAYDIYMSKLLDTVLSWLGYLGVPVIVMSATLPAKRRQELIGAWRYGAMAAQEQTDSSATLKDPPLDAGGPDAEQTAAGGPYPRVTLVEPGSARPQVMAARVSRLNRNRVVRLERIRDEEVISRLLETARSGGCAAVIHNLRRRAHATHRALKAAVEEEYRGCPEAERPLLIYFTGELNGRARRKVELCLLRWFGPRGSRPAAIVVATQTLEQSLDLDFDFMVSDLAPVDLLIQRAGRLHRHRREEKRGTPVLAICGVTDTAKGPRFPDNLGNVYKRMVLLRTYAILRDRAELRSPDDIPEVIDRVYGDPDAVKCPAGWESVWKSAAKSLNRVEKNEKYDASAMHLPPPGDDIAELHEMTRNPKSPARTRNRRKHESAGRRT